MHYHRWRRHGDVSPPEPRGKCKTYSERRIYRGINKRCHNPASHEYARYGGSGIECRFKSFEEFFAAVGPRPSADYSIDRIDGNGHNEVGNVRWATAKQQARNRRDNRLLTVGDETHCLSEWAEMTGISRDTLQARRRSGWCVSCVVHLPISAGNRCSHIQEKANDGNK